MSDPDGKKNPPAERKDGNRRGKSSDMQAPKAAKPSEMGLKPRNRQKTTSSEPLPSTSTSTESDKLSTMSIQLEKLLGLIPIVQTLKEAYDKSNNITSKRLLQIGFGFQYRKQSKLSII